jgi:transcriptional regulator with XRE-family HTH domain
MDEDGVRIGRNLVSLRKEKGLTQTALADAMREAGQDHWRQNTVSRVEGGQQPLNLGEIRALSRIVSARLLEGTELAEGLRATAEEINALVIREQLTRATALLREATDALAMVQELMARQPVESEEPVESGEPVGRWKLRPVVTRRRSDRG